MHTASQAGTTPDIIPVPFAFIISFLDTQTHIQTEVHTHMLTPTPTQAATSPLPQPSRTRRHTQIFTLSSASLCMSRGISLPSSETLRFSCCQPALPASDWHLGPTTFSFPFALPVIWGFIFGYISLSSTACPLQIPFEEIFPGSVWKQTTF